MAPAGYGDRVEGAHAVAAALAAGRVRRLFVERGRRDRLDVGLDLDHPGSVDVVLVDDVTDYAETGAPQGVVAECRPIMPVTLESLAVDRCALVVLDHVEDPHNVGAVARSALAAGVGGLILSTRRASPLSATAFKAAAGALERLPVALVGSVAESLSRLRKLGVWTVGLAASARESLFGLGLLTESVAVVVGSEGKGLSQLVAERCDQLVRIPMIGPTESLNVSVSAALAAFEIMRARHANGSSPG
jgi:23S rRNA (guanosine2251-2'-O)-methyltransferase